MSMVISTSTLALSGLACNFAHFGVDHPSSLLKVTDEAVTSLRHAGVDGNVGKGFENVAAFSQIAAQSAVVYAEWGGSLDVGEVEKNGDLFDEETSGRR